MDDNSTFFPLVEVRTNQVEEKEKKPEQTPREGVLPSCNCPKIEKGTKIFFGACFLVGCLLLSACVGVFSMTIGVSPYFIFSYVPYFILAGLVFLFGPPFPFVGKQGGFNFLETETSVAFSDCYIFLIASLAPSPLAISSIIVISGLRNPAVTLIFISHGLIIISSLLFLRAFFTPLGSRDLLGGDSDDDDEEMM